MLLAILQAMLKFVLILGTIFGLAFMVICIALVIVYVIRGDIRINIVRSRTNIEKNKQGSNRNVEVYSGCAILACPLMSKSKTHEKGE